MTELIGVSVPRLEDRTLLLGQGRFAADINFPGQLHMRVVRSAVPHGRILTIDSAAALASEGTAAVWTGADVAAIPPIDFRQVKVMGLEPYRQPILAAKMLAMLDVLSQGRLVVGVGAGWMKEEFELLGAPPFPRRGQATDDFLRACVELWTQERPSYLGDYAKCLSNAAPRSLT